MALINSSAVYVLWNFSRFRNEMFNNSRCRRWGRVLSELCHVCCSIGCAHCCKNL